MARRDAEKRRDELSEEDEDQKHVEEPGRRLGGADLHRLPDEAGEEKGGAESHETAEEKEEPVRREDDVGRAADSKNLPASEREGGHDRRPSGRDRERDPESSVAQRRDRKAGVDEIPVPEDHRHRHRSQEERRAQARKYRDPLRRRGARAGGKHENEDRCSGREERQRLSAFAASGHRHVPDRGDEAQRRPREPHAGFGRARQRGEGGEERAPEGAEPQEAHGETMEERENRREQETAGGEMAGERGSHLGDHL